MVNPLIGRKVYVDASALIYAVEMPAQFPGLLNGLLAPLSKGELRLVTSWITLAEVLIHPIKSGDAVLESTYRRLLMPSTFFDILPVEREITDRAATLRASHGFKLPDAIHIATGIAAHCAIYISGDAQWSRAGVQVIDPADLQA